MICGIPIALQFEMPVDLLGVIAALMGSSVLLVFGLLIVLARRATVRRRRAPSAR